VVVLADVHSAQVCFPGIAPLHWEHYLFHSNMLRNSHTILKYTPLPRSLKQTSSSVWNPLAEEKCDCLWEILADGSFKAYNFIRKYSTLTTATRFMSFRFLCFDSETPGSTWPPAIDQARDRYSSSLATDWSNK